MFLCLEILISFFHKKPLLILHNVFQTGVNIYLKTNLNSLIPSFTEYVIQSVKRGTCFYVKILDTFLPLQILDSSMKINNSRSIYTDRLLLTQDRSFTTAVEREISQYVGTFNVILSETSSDLADNIMKVNIYLKDNLHSTILFFVESFTQLVKRGVCLYVGILDTFSVESLFRSWIMLYKTFSAP